MAKATGKTVRTMRIEVTDEQGRVRLVLGLLGPSEHGVYGLAVSDATGRDRAWIMQDGPAAEVGLDYGGETVAALTVADGGRVNLHLAE